MPYTNLDGTTPDKGPIDLLKWRFSQRRVKTAFRTPVRENDGALLVEPHLTWIGHATFAMKLGGLTIATDPIWSGRLPATAGSRLLRGLGGEAPITTFGPLSTRLAPPGVPLDRMPPIDVVTISHSHYDHLDLPTLRRIGPKALYVVPRDVGDILRDAGLPHVVELGWWESHVHEGVRITLVPAQHWSMRVPWDRNKRLWGGFVFQGEEGVAYHAGDTAFSEQVFSEIAKRVPRIDWVMMPIGAYDPQWFMQPQHINPEEAVAAFELLGGAHFCAMHWGTFELTDEPLGEPPERLRARWTERGLDPARLHIFDVGETMLLR